MQQKRKIFSRVALGVLVAFTFSSGILLDTAILSPAAAYAKEAKQQLPKGEVIAKGVLKGISRKAKMITLDQKDQGFSFIKFNDKTVFKNVESASKLKAGEKIKIHYKKIGGENVALEVDKILVKLPEGVSEIKTKALEEIIAGKREGKFVLVDARPLPKYRENHIPGAVSLPYAKLKKVADSKEKGLKLLHFDKDATLIFYCGGDT